MGGGNWCCAVGCSNSTRNNRSVSYHRFPSEGALREQWQRAVRRDKWSPSNATRLCSEHFHVDCYEVTSLLRAEFGLGHGYRQLKPGSVPTMFKHTEPRRPPIERGALAKRRRAEVSNARVKINNTPLFTCDKQLLRFVFVFLAVVSRLRAL